MKTRETVQGFGKFLGNVLKTDRWVLLACDGKMGEGKSCFTSQLAQAAAQTCHTPFNYDTNMTFSRQELSIWIDGDENGKKQKSEFSAILADELISMFFKRNWYDKSQINGIELLNKCRDRHQLILGNVPNFWDLDGAIKPIITFWVHIPERGRAWVFEQDKNPWSKDKWHQNANEKYFRKKKNPYGALGFVCEIRFPDWTSAEKAQYYKVRNVKRVGTEGQREEKIVPHTKLRRQRNKLIRLYYDPDKPQLKDGKLAEHLGIDRAHLNQIKNGVVV